MGGDGVLGLAIKNLRPIRAKNQPKTVMKGNMEDSFTKVSGEGTNSKANIEWVGIIKATSNNIGKTTTAITNPNKKPLVPNINKLEDNKTSTILEPKPTTKAAKTNIRNQFHPPPSPKTPRTLQKTAKVTKTGSKPKQDKNSILKFIEKFNKMGETEPRTIEEQNLEPKQRYKEEAEPVETVKEEPNNEPMKTVNNKEPKEKNRNQGTKDSRVKRILEPKPALNQLKKKGPLSKNLQLEDGVISLKT